MWVFALTVTASAAWLLDRWRSRARNGRGSCGGCAVSWVEALSSERYLIHGRLVCEDCARKARRRMPWELGALGVWAALLSALAVGNLLAGNAVAIGIFAIVASAIVVPLGAIEAMKVANRRAQARIAEGELPAITPAKPDNEEAGGNSLPTAI